MSKFFMVRVLEECNWKCEYCTYKTNNSSPNDLKAIELFEEHKNRLTHITGGEPGLLSDTFWSHVFSSRKVGVLTNGLFIKKGYYKKYHDRLTHLYIHVVPELNFDISPEVLEVIKSRDPIVEPSIVVHSKNISLIKNFLDKYKDIEFSMTLSGTQFSPDIGYTISDKKTALSIIKVLKDYPQYKGIVNNLFKAILTNSWNLCFIPNIPVTSCDTCPMKCWVNG